MKWKLSIVFILLCVWSGKAFTYPDCNSILSISEFELLSEVNKRKTIHPYLLKAYCNSEKESEFIGLYLDTFKNESSRTQRLNELSSLLHKMILKSDTNDFLDLFGQVLNDIKERYPSLAKRIQYINLYFSYAINRLGRYDACNFLNENSTFSTIDLPIDISSYAYLTERSICADYTGDTNTSIFYLVQALKIARQLEYPKNRLKSGHIYKSIAIRYYELEDYNNSIKYADSTINTFLPDFKQKIGLGVGYEYKALSVYQLKQDINQALSLFENAQKIYKKIENTSRFHFVERLKAEIYLKEHPELASQHLFNFINYFYKNKRKLHYTTGWLLAHEILQKHQLKELNPTENKTITHQQVIDSLTTFLPKEELKNKLKISSALIEYYSTNINKDSLYKYNKLQNQFEAQQNEINHQQKKTNVNLYLTNYQKEQELAGLNLMNQKRSYQNKLLISLVCFVFIGLIFYYLYKRKQKQILNTQFHLKEAEHFKLKAEHQLNEELILRKEQNEKILKLAFDNELKGKQLLQLQLQQKQNEFEAAQLEKQSSDNLLNEVFLALKDEKVNDASHLVRKLQTNQIITKQNNSLKELFESISPNFMQHLNEINPSLTEQDILYCVLIRQKKSTKQIAFFLNISPKSVNQHKYRLKKKLAISKEENINDFISKIEFSA